eukprot:365428-Chlamydomonas_euryale.AAC.7
MAHSLAKAAAAQPAPNYGGNWTTDVHQRGYCAMPGVCGHRADGDALNCAANTQAQPAGVDLAAVLQVWSMLGGCCHRRRVEGGAQPAGVNLAAVLQVWSMLGGCCHRRRVRPMHESRCARIPGRGIIVCRSGCAAAQAGASCTPNPGRCAPRSASLGSVCACSRAAKARGSLAMNLRRGAPWL